MTSSVSSVYILRLTLRCRPVLERIFWAYLNCKWRTQQRPYKRLQHKHLSSFPVSTQTMCALIGNMLCKATLTSHGWSAKKTTTQTTTLIPEFTKYQQAAANNAVTPPCSEPRVCFSTSKDYGPFLFVVKPFFLESSYKIISQWKKKRKINSLPPTAK